jgi:hypothetical protein
VYAEVVGSVSALTALLYCIPFVLRFSFVWVWSLVLFVLWITLFGLFGNVRALSNCRVEVVTDILLQMYIHENPEGNADIQRMKNAVWVVLTNAILWLIGAVAGALYWWRHKDRRSRFTGRAQV